MTNSSTAILTGQRRTTLTPNNRIFTEGWFAMSKIKMFISHDHDVATSYDLYDGGDYDEYLVIRKNG